MPASDMPSPMPNVNPMVFHHHSGILVSLGLESVRLPLNT